MNPRNALILGRSNGVGLDRDARILGVALAEIAISSQCPRLRSLQDLLSSAFRADYAFHLERVAPWWRRKARVHILIPNQERFPARLLKRLELVDHIFCKSQHATEVFSAFHPSVHFLGFSSEDRLLENIQPDYSRFFHLAGKSTLKNTEVLLTLWSRHPEWPTLTLVQHPDNAPKSVPGNVQLISRYIDNDELQQIQNSCGIHLCPSLSEGWGHYIVEAMSCRAVTLITDAPPMNELVTPGRGISVPFTHSEPRHLGENFYVDISQLEISIENLIAQPIGQKAELGCAARKWFLSNEVQFHRRIRQQISSLLIE